MAQAQNISIVGLPSSGKTVFLSVLSNDQDFSPWSAAAVDMNQKYARLRQGKWPEATDPNSKPGDLTWRISAKRSGLILNSRDFAGETWSHFIKKYGNWKDKAPAPDDDDRELCDYLKNSAAVAVCVDLAAVIDDNDIRQLWIPQAIRNFIGDDSKLAIILTKYDLVEAYIRQNGGLTKVLGDKFPRELLDALDGRIFHISAVQTVVDDRNIRVPVPRFTPNGVQQVKKWMISISLEQNTWNKLWRSDIPLSCLFITAKNFGVIYLVFCLVLIFAKSFNPLYIINVLLVLPLGLLGMFCAVASLLLIAQIFGRIIDAFTESNKINELLLSNIIPAFFLLCVATAFGIVFIITLIPLINPNPLMHFLSIFGILTLYILWITLWVIASLFFFNQKFKWIGLTSLIPKHTARPEKNRMGKN